MSAKVLRLIVEQHASDAAFRWTQRSVAVSAPHYVLKDLLDLDERIEANLNGLHLAGDIGWELCEAQQTVEDPGTLFASIALGLESGRLERLDALWALFEVEPTQRVPLVSALAWSSAAGVEEVIRSLLTAKAPTLRAAGIRACAARRKDHAGALSSCLDDSEPMVRAAALRAAGELGRRDLIRELEGRTGEPLRQQPRQQIEAVGCSGDASRIPWLLDQARDEKLARVAGEAFTLMTGANLERLRLTSPARPPVSSRAGGRPAGMARPTDRKSERELIVTRTVNGPARIVFEAWTKPELLQRWWAPKSFGVFFLSCEADVRVEGKYRFVFGHAASTQPMEFFGSYLEVIPHSRLAWTNDEAGEGGAVTTVTFEERGGRTRVVVHDLYPSKEAVHSRSIDEVAALGQY